MKYAFIDQRQDQWPVEVLCDALEVSRGGYYDWKKREPGKQEKQREQLMHKVRIAFEENRGVYGSPRVHRVLQAQGVSCCENTVARRMQELGLQARCRKRFVVQTTDSDHGYPVADNELDQQFTVSAPNQVWAADITYIPTEQGWLYLAVVIDLCSRRVVGWSMADHLRSELTRSALEMALARRRPPPGLLHHSDRGVQYACEAYQRLMIAAGLRCSMSRRGNCYDNAPVESFFGTLKQELVYRTRFAGHRQARLAIFEYIEAFYNRKRRHSFLGYLSPEQFEAGLN